MPERNFQKDAKAGAPGTAGNSFAALPALRQRFAPGPRGQQNHRVVPDMPTRPVTWSAPRRNRRDLQHMPQGRVPERVSALM